MTATVSKNNLKLNIIIFALSALLIFDLIFFQTYIREIATIFCGCLCGLGIAAAVLGGCGVLRYNTGLSALVWCAFTVLSVLWAYAPGHAFAEALKACSMFAALIIGFFAVKNGGFEKLLELIVVLMCVSAIMSLEAVSTEIFIPFFREGLSGGGPYVFWDGRLMAMPNANVAAILFFAAILITRYLRARTEKYKRLFLTAAGALCAELFILCVSLGSVLVCGVVAVLYICLQKPRLNSFLYLLFVFAGGALSAVSAAYGLENGLTALPLISAAFSAPLAVFALFLEKKLKDLTARAKGYFTAGVCLIIAVLSALVLSAGGMTRVDGELIATRTAEVFPGQYTFNIKINNGGSDSGIKVYARYLRYDEQGIEQYCGEMEEFFIYATDGAHTQTLAAPKDAQALRLDIIAAGSFDFEPIKLIFENGKSAEVHFSRSPLYLFERRTAGISHNQSAAERFLYYRDARKIWQRSPIIGSGAGAFETLSPKVQDHAYKSRFVHSHYLQTLVETGIIGLILFAVMMFFTIKNLIKGLKSDKNAAAVLLLCVLLTMLAHSAIDFDMSFELYSAVFMILVSASAALFGKVYKTIKGRFIIVSALILPVLGAVSAIGHGLALSELNALNKETEQKGYVSLDKLNRSVPFAIAADPLHRYDYMLDYLNVTYNESLTPQYAKLRDRYAEILSTQSSKSAAISQVLAAYYIRMERAAEAVKIAEELPKIRPLDASLYQISFAILDELAAAGKDAEVREAAAAARQSVIELYVENESKLTGFEY